MRAITTLLIAVTSTLSSPSSATIVEYGATACKNPGYHCVKIERGDSWGRLFPDFGQRQLIVFANRYNGFLKPGMILAVPDDLTNKSLFDLSPLPLKIKSYNERVIIINQQKLAWGAYNKVGLLLRWGPISAGSEKCESDSGCATPAGSYRIQRKLGRNCYSNSFPIKISGQHGGAYMPYCMFFHNGFALHGSESLPGYNASHGCVRLIEEDAKWLNENFTNLSPENGTKIIIESV